MKRIRKFIAAAILSAIASPLFAGAGFPTFDLTGYLQEILGYTQDGQQIANEIKNWENELKRWQQVYKAFEGGDLESILGGINGAVGRLDNTLGRYNISVGWLDNVADLSTSVSDTGFDLSDLLASGEFSPRDMTRLYDDITDLSTDVLSLSADIKAATIDNKKQRAEEGEQQAESAEDKESKANTALTGGSSAQTEGTVASEAIEQTTNALSDTYDALTDANAEATQEELESLSAQLALLFGLDPGVVGHAGNLDVLRGLEAFGERGVALPEHLFVHAVCFRQPVKRLPRLHRVDIVLRPVDVDDRPGFLLCHGAEAPQDQEGCDAESFHGRHF